MSKALEGDSSAFYVHAFYHGLDHLLFRSTGRKVFMNRDRIIALLREKVEEYREKALSHEEFNLLHTYALVFSELSSILNEIENYEE